MSDAKATYLVPLQQPEHREPNERTRERASRERNEESVKQVVPTLRFPQGWAGVKKTTGRQNSSNRRSVSRHDTGAS